MLPKTLIIRLIANDLVHLRLLYALKRSGLQPDAGHYSGQTELIFELLGLNDTPKNEKLFQLYLKLSKEVEAGASEKEVRRAAERIYGKLKV
jgi:hypothetical protein